MINFEINARTAGAYVLYNGYFVFMFGFGTNHKDNELGVVRFGGHLEKGETAIQCVIREVKEESSLDVDFYDNKYIYIEKDNGTNYDKIKGNEVNNPIYVNKWKDNSISIMYLAYGRGKLAPSMETQGILLLRKEDINLICSNNTTFKEYKNNGGKFILVNPLPDDAFLISHNQLYFLNKLFTLESELMTNYVKSVTP